jgi:hypothetical protein
VATTTKNRRLKATKVNSPGKNMRKRNHQAPDFPLIKEFIILTKLPLIKHLFWAPLGK